MTAGLKPTFRVVVAQVFLLLLTGTGRADDNFLEMSLEDLMDVEIVSVSKKTESLGEVPSSVYVITAEDIRRSSATQLTDVLNLVPGAFTVDCNYNTVVTGIRSPASSLSGSVLLLVDGVPMNWPVRGSPRFELIDLPLEQIEKIEVIKGPGGTVYGAGANTGIINVFTKRATVEPGWHIVTAGGNPYYGSVYARYAEQTSEDGGVSAWVSYKTTYGYNKPEMLDGETLVAVKPDGTDTVVTNPFTVDGDRRRKTITGGVRFESQISPKVKGTSWTQVWSTRYGQYVKTRSEPLPRLSEVTSFSIVGQQQIDIRFNDNHSMFARVRFDDWMMSDLVGGEYEPDTRILDLEAQNNLIVGGHDLTMGMDFRVVDYDIKGVNDGLDAVGFTTPRTTERLYSAFVQDRLGLSESTTLTAGIKAETWTLISRDPELSPSVRLLTKLNDNTALWAGYARSVTTPGFVQTRIESTLAEITDPDPSQLLPGTNRLFVTLVNGDGVDAVRYDTYELGFRSKIQESTSLDLALFYYGAAGVIGDMLVMGSGGPVYSEVYPDRTLLRAYLVNAANADSYGGEAVLRRRFSTTFGMELSYALFKIEYEALNNPESPGQKYTLSVPEYPATAEHTVRARAYLDFPESGWSISSDALWCSAFSRGSEHFQALQIPSGSVSFHIDEPDDETVLDLRIEKRLLDERLSLYAWGKDILADEAVRRLDLSVESSYPQSVHRTFGVGLAYTF